MPFSLPTTTHAGKPWSTLQVSISQEAFWGWRRLEDMQLKALLATSGIEAIIGWCSIITRQSLSRGPVHPAAHWLWQQSLGTFPLHRPEHCWAQMTFVTGKKQRTKKWKTSAVLAEMTSRNTETGSGAGSVLDFPRGTFCPHLRPKFGRGESECGWW